MYGNMRVVSGTRGLAEKKMNVQETRGVVKKQLGLHRTTKGVLKRRETLSGHSDVVRED